MTQRIAAEPATRAPDSRRRWSGLAGARAVQVGTANFVDAGVYGRILAGLTDYLVRHGLPHIGAVTGTLQFPRALAEAPR